MMKTCEMSIKQSTQNKKVGEKKSIRWKDPSPGKKKKPPTKADHDQIR
jgi:hypothetical protein